VLKWKALKVGLFCTGYTFKATKSR
jgi:hypothetical protein